MYNKIYSRIKMTRDEALKEVFVRKINALAALQQMADIFNGDWIPDWDDINEKKYYIGTDFHSVSPHVRARYAGAGMIFFQNEEDVRLAIDKMGSSLRFLFNNPSSHIAEVVDGNSWDPLWVLTAAPSDIQEAAEAVMRNTEQVTSLDVKQILRSNHYYAVQAEVASKLRSLANDKGWVSVLTDKGDKRHLVYSKTTNG